MRTSFHHQSEAQPPNGPLTVATSPDTPSTTSATQSVSVGYVQLCARGAVSAADHPPLLSHTKSFFVMCITSRPQL
jgi:hypothetical protein